MFGCFKGLSQMHKGPDPRHTVLQKSFVSGGLLSVALAYFVSKVISVSDLGYAALGMTLIALLTIAVEQARTGTLKRAAEKAMREAEEGRRLGEYGEHSDALDALQESLLTSELGYGSYHPQVATIVSYLAELMWSMKRTDAATTLYERAVLIHTRLGANSAEYVAALQQLAEHLERIEDHEKGLIVAKRVVSTSNKLHGRSVEYGMALLVLSEVQDALEDSKTAYQTSKKASSVLMKCAGRSDPRTLRAKSLVANLSVSLGRIAEGERIIREVLVEKERSKASLDEDYLGLLLDLLIIQEKAGDNTASVTMQKAVELFRSEIGPDYERAEEILSRLPAHVTKDAPEMERKFLQALLANDGMVARQTLSDNESVLNYVDASGWTPLQWAVFLDRRDLAERLISKGADHNYGAGTDLPALFIAARWGRKRLISALFQKDADIDIETVDGSRPIHGAVRSGDPFTYDTLANRSAKLEPPNKLGWTILHEAAYMGDRKLLIQLITKGLDINLQTGSKREAPIHAAVAGGHSSTVEALILNGADLNVSCAAGRTPLRLAQQLQKKDVLTLLESNSEPAPAEPEAAG